jgi:hypothetical protein
MLGDISDEEANELIGFFSKTILGNFQARNFVESKIFPVTQYIHTACYILYDQSYQYNILKDIARNISPKELARRSKSFGSPLNQLSFYSLAMLYLQGRAMVINDNYFRKKSGEANVIVEPDEKKIETKFILDFWKRLSPNYRNDGALTAVNKKIQFIPEKSINDLKDQMITVDQNIEIVKKLRRTIAHLSIFNFLFQAECRAGISEHGPYYFEDDPDPLLFKEFQFLYTDEKIFGIDLSALLPQKISHHSPVSNVIFGYTLKNMNKIEFNDWGTLFADPIDYSSNITSIGIWTKELIHPKNLRYPDNMGVIKPLPISILDELSEFAKNATKDLYIEYTKWSRIKKLMLGASLYANNFMAVACGYAGIEDNYNWTWAMDYAEDKPLMTDLLDREKITEYITKLERWDGSHPFLKRIMRGIRIRKKDPFYYYLQEEKQDELIIEK